MARNLSIAGYREIVDQNEAAVKWKEVSLQAGSSAGLTKDATFADAAGGYVYRESNVLTSIVHNRFLYWRTSNDILEAVEISLDLNLDDNHLRLHFHGAPIAQVDIQETRGNVVLLVVTTCSVHRLLFPHPCSLQSQDIRRQNAESSVASIFTSTSVSRLEDAANNHVFNAAAAAGYQVTAASSYLAADGVAVFAIALQTGGLIIVKMPAFGSPGVVEQREIKQSVMSRLWGGMLPSLIMKSSTDASGDATASLCLHTVKNNVIVFTVCRNNKIRMWSTNTYECLLTVDLLQYLPDSVDAHKAAAGATHIIDKSVDIYGQALYLTVFLSFVNKSQFLVFQVVYEDNRYQFNHIKTIFGPDGSLVDFKVTANHLWSLWCSNVGEMVTKYTSIKPEGQSRSHWLDAVMSPPLKDHLNDYGVKSLDPRELYLEHIFSPHRFSVLVILKALNIFRRTPNVNPLADIEIPIRVLKQEVSDAVANEIRQAASGYEMQEEEYIELQCRQWARFYSNCVQYQQRSSKAVGLFADDATGLVCVVNKGSLSYLRPCDTLERLYVDPPYDDHKMDECLRDELAGADVQLCRDVSSLLICLRMIQRKMDGELGYFFEQDLYYNGDPVDLAGHICQYLVQSFGELIQNVIGQLREVHEPFRAAETVVSLLDVSQHFSPNVDSSTSPVTNCLFSSRAGVGVLYHSFRQFAETRMLIGRDLLLLLMIIRQQGVRIGDDTALKTMEVTYGNLMATIGCIIRSYFVMKWCSQTIARPANASTLESTRKQLDELHMLTSTTYRSALRLADNNLTLIEMFVRVQRNVIIEYFQNGISIGDTDSWDQSLLSVLNVVSQFIWPSFPGFIFAKSLVGQCQHLAIQEYVRLTQPWSDVNIGSCNFILGQSYLHSSEPDKALECFLSAAQHLMVEDFLLSLITHTGSEQGAQWEVSYYLQVIHLFELFDLADHVLRIVRLVIGMAQKDDPNLPTLWSKLFKYHLELGHSEDAYNAMLSNPDASRRKDCLRQFLVVLCERNELNLLVTLPYRDMDVVLEPEVVTILESRARSIDLSKHKYYELLYAFNIHRSNYRAAGSVMYEQSTRFAREQTGLKSVEGQAKCLLAAMNALRLGDPKYAWVVKRVKELDSDDTIDSDEALSPPKRHCAAKNPLNDVPYKPCNKLQVLELADLEKEYMLLHAILELAKRSSSYRTRIPHTVSIQSRAKEIIGLLVEAGLFDKAVHISQVFGFKLDPLFDNLVVRCIQLARNAGYDGSGISNPCAFLVSNECLLDSAKQAGSGPADMAWYLLQTYLEKFEDRTSRYHRCVTTKLIQHGFEIPSWLIASYKKLNAAELLRLYLDYDLLTEASELALEYIHATLGAGKEYFGLHDYVHSGGTAVWLPYTALDQLLSALQDAQNDKHYARLYSNLCDTLDEYFRAVGDAVPRDMMLH